MDVSNSNLIENQDKNNSLNTIRALHETVVSLRSALEKSKSEILSLKTSDVLDKENQHLKKHIQNLKELKNDCVKRSGGGKIELINVTHNVSSKKNKKKNVKVDITVELLRKKQKKARKMDDPEVVEEKLTDQQSQIPIVTMTTPSISDKITHIVQKSASVDYLDQELDNIELIFTTDDTKEFKEDCLVSIDAPRNRLRRPLSNYEELSGSDRDLDDDVFNDNLDSETLENAGRFRIASDSRCGGGGMYDSKSDNSINNPDMKSLRSCYSYHDSSFENKSLEKDESFDRFEENIHIVETDISKVGIQESSEYISVRRNTCPNPMQYRPIIHREALSKSSRRTRPVLGQSAMPRRESGAQTDISALPSSSAWRSESSLARKIRIGDTPITTLPSKYPHPASCYQPNTRHLSATGKYPHPSSHGIAINISSTGQHPSRGNTVRRPSADTKTLEARRVLLSDIGFTSMVPELSRSADHLAGARGEMVDEGGKGEEKVVEYGRYLQAGDCGSPGYSSQRFLYSPLDSRYSSTTLPSAAAQPPTPGICLDTVPHCSSFLTPTSMHKHRRCSAPVSPNRYFTGAVVGGGRGAGNAATSGCPLLQHQCSVGATGGCCGRGAKGFGFGKGRVRFATGHSMPDLRASGSLDCCDSGDSTDSLLEETEQFLRRSIDCIVDVSMGSGHYGQIRSSAGGVRAAARRASAPEPHRDNIPPLGWHPFLPRQPRDLRPDYWVKVIGPEGRVRGGRVRYIGDQPIQQQRSESILVGVQLSNPDGQCDGVWEGRRYFQCEPDHGLFVPFKKIVMGWKP